MSSLKHLFFLRCIIHLQVVFVTIRENKIPNLLRKLLNDSSYAIIMNKSEVETHEVIIEILENIAYFKITINRL